MNKQNLIDTARSLVADNKSTLAIDESNQACNKRFPNLGIPKYKNSRNLMYD